MKTYRYGLMMFALLLSTFVACTNDVDFNDNNIHEKLIMNAFISADSTNNILCLNMTGRKNAPMVKDGKVEVRVNGELKEVVSAYSYVGRSEDDKRDSVIYTNEYHLNTVFRAGNVVRIDANTSDGQYHAYIEEKVPQPINSAISIDVDTTAMQKQVQYKISFDDRVSEKNYYRLVLKSYSLYDIAGNSFRFAATEKYDCSRDIIMMDGQVSMSGDAGDVFGLNYKDNFYGIFPDTRFENKQCALTIYTDKHRAEFAVDVLFQIESITESEYYYLKALNIYSSDNYDDEDPLSGPMKFPSNVRGGAGIVGIHSAAVKVIKLQGNYY